MPRPSILLLAVVCFLATSIFADKMLAGGKTPQNADDAEHMDRAWKAVNGELNNDASNNGPYHFIPIKILKATSQVVAGVKYDYEVLVGESSCKKGEIQAVQLTAANCQLKEDGQRAIYNISVWEKPWENFAQYDVQKVRTVDASETF